MNKLIQKILKEELEGFESEGSKYIVFVAGTNTTGVAHSIQYDAFDKGLGDVSSNVKYFNYNTHKDKGSELYTWLEKNKTNVVALVLFSAACTLANKLSPTYVPTSKTYCIEPWASPNGKDTWTNISANNFYVNATDWRRGAGAKTNIPEKNKNNLSSHIAALTAAVKLIF
jgi:hypothetical protein